MTKNLYDYFENIRLRPSMYTPDKSLLDIEKLVHGYQTCLSMNQIVEKVEGRPFNPREFSEWLYQTSGWSGCRGFAAAIYDHSYDTDEAFDRFFELVKLFRARD